MGISAKAWIVSVMLVVVGALLLAGTPAVAGPGQTQLQRDLDALRDLGVTGALARLETGDGVQTARSGVAELDTARPVPGNPVLRAGSVTKTFVATVVLQLVAEGRLSLSDPVERWLPGVVAGNGNDGRHVTVRQLLQQTSGLYDYANDIYPTLTTPEDYRRERWRTAGPDELVALAMQHAPADQVWAYSNTNYVLAGMVIKSVTGRDWTTEVRERIIAPLRLRHTATPGTWPFLPHPHAHNYQQWTPDGPLIDTTIAVRALDSGADGSIISTAEDLNTFITALVGGRLLPAAQLADMQTLVEVPSDLRGHTGYGLGLYYHPLPCGGGSWTHGGNGIGYNVEVIATHTGARRLTVAEFSRSFDPAAEDARAAARRTLIERAMCGR
ncbi:MULTISPECIES: beta-lactamase family protein [unclassified Streptomyces]|uniref:serine hydrolase domain-containing protein n=1 Tax=unclassified Streptomyces TaxID=2593676 RepID=UPI001F10CCF0|nr:MULTISPECIES: beta-lactamase family protein [unclassified Streptomyces]